MESRYNKEEKSTTRESGKKELESIMDVKYATTEELQDCKRCKLNSA